MSRWFLRSAADRDTHAVQQLHNGRVHAICGAQFQPIRALPGLPPDGGKVCILCYREALRDARKSCHVGFSPSSATNSKARSHSSRT
jgi:hypothetical protein